MLFDVCCLSLLVVGFSLFVVFVRCRIVVVYSLLLVAVRCSPAVCS